MEKLTSQSSSTPTTTETDTEHACTQCGATFLQRKRLNEHVKRQHGDASSRTCPHCAKLFSSAGSLPRHVKRCTQRPENLVVCSVPPSSVPASPSDSRSKAKVGKQSLPTVEDYIPILKAYLLAGKFIYSFATRRSSLAPTTVTSYCSFVRKYLEAIYRGLTPREGQHHTTEVVTTRVLLLTSIRLQHISTFISSLRDDEFKARTAVNYMSAISWHLTYLKFLTHPDLDTNGWAPSLQGLRSIFCPELANKKRVLERQLTESHQYLHQQISSTSDEATQQTKARNSGEALQLRGRWVRFEWMMTVARAINEEGWGRMRCLQALLAAGETHEVLCLRPQGWAQLNWLRDWIVFSFFVDMPPMRPQNAHLEVLDSIEPPGCRKTNGILFFKERCCIQLVHFKNKRFAGEHIIELPAALTEKLLAYMKFVRPAYGLTLEAGLLEEKDTATHHDNEAEAASDNEDNNADSVEEELDSHQAKEATSQLNMHGDALRRQTMAWRKQSCWLFLNQGNRPRSNIGATFTSFAKDMTGRHIMIGVWRKVVETQSSETNSYKLQQGLSRALLHQHQTGQQYYVS